MKKPAGTLFFLILLNLLTYMDRQVLAGVEASIAKDLLPGDPNAMAKMGLCATAFLVSYMVFSPLFGHLGVRVSRWWLVGLGTIFGSLATAMTGAAGFIHSFIFLLMMRCAVGISEAAYAPVAPAILSDLYPVEKRGQILSYFYIAVPVGSALGYALGGLAVSVASWEWAFFVLGPPGILLGAIACFIPDTRASLFRKQDASVNAAQALPAAPSRVGQYKQLLANNSYVFCCLGMTAMTFAIGAMSFFMPRYISVDRQAGSLGTVNLIFGVVVVVSGLLATLAGGWLGDALRKKLPGSYFIVSAGGLFMAFPMILLLLVVPFPYAWVFVFLSVFFLFFNTGPANAILANVTSPALRTTGFALNIFVIHALGDAISPFILGGIADRSSLSVGFLLVSGMVLLGGVYWLMGAKYLAADTQMAEQEAAAEEASGLTNVSVAVTSSAAATGDAATEVQAK